MYCFIFAVYITAILGNTDFARNRAQNNDWLRPRMTHEPAIPLTRNYRDYGNKVELYFTSFVLAPGSEAIIDWCTKTESEKTITKIFHFILSRDNARESGEIVLDIGANYGFYGILSASLGWRTYMFEPQPTCHIGIDYAIIANSVQDTAILVPHAVAYPQFMMEITRSSNCNGRFPMSAAEQDSHFFGWGNGTRSSAALVDKTVDIATMFDQQQHFAIVKIDTEGNELNVLRSIAPLLRQRKIYNLIVEISPAFWKTAHITDSAMIEILCFITRQSYKGIVLSNTYPPLTFLSNCTHVQALLDLRPKFIQVDLWFSVLETFEAMLDVIGYE